MTLFDNVGGQCLGKVVDKFYEQVLGNPKLAVHFEGYDVTKVNKGQRTFLTMVLILSNQGVWRAQKLSRTRHEDCS